MERKDFIKNGLGFLGMAVAAPALLRAGKPGHVLAFSEPDTLVCPNTASETAGPFPTHTPSSLVQADIRGDRTGIVLTVNLTINNQNADCAAYPGAIVDIWHCDKDGNYSEYGGTGMQPTNYTNYHFLRGRQTTNASGLVSFTTVFPGWYTGRATHIHVHVYTASGTSLLVTQIAFPEGAGSAVNTVNASTVNGYTKGMTGYTYNANDNVFSDGVSTELSAITGNVAEGYVLSHSINVAGPTLAVQTMTAYPDKVGQNYPNPFKTQTNIPVSLASAAQVTLQIFDLNGRRIGRPMVSQLAQGQHVLALDNARLGLSGGYYLYDVRIENAGGVCAFSRKMVVE